MKTRFLFLTFNLIRIIVSGQTDMQQYLYETNNLVKEGKYAVALERHIWFHDHVLEHDGSMVGVRVSFALAYWKGLGDKYPPAMVALKKLRDDDAQKLLDKKGDVEIFREVTHINEYMSDNLNTNNLFTKIVALQPDLAAVCFKIAKKSLFKEKNYELLFKYLSNPIADYYQIESDYKTETLRNQDPDFIKYNMKPFTDDQFVQKCLRLLDFTIAKFDLQTSQKIQSLALNTFKDERLINAVQK